MGMLAWLESTSIAVWVHESPSVWAQPTVMTLHTMGMAVLVGACWIMDMRLLGITPNIPLSAFRWVFPTVVIGLIVNLTTGVLLFMQRATTLGTSIPFLVKMFFVVVSVATLVPIRSYALGGDAPSSDMTSRARVLAIVSIVAWAAAVTAGRLLAYLIP